MFSSLKKKWKVNNWQLTIILCNFALGGSLTGYLGKKIMNLLAIQADWLWTLVYILLITLIWPLAVIALSIPLGQFRFFRKYITKLLSRIGLAKKSSPVLPKKHIAIFASGAGSNAQKIIDHFRGHETVRIVLIVCNKPGAGVLNIAVKEGIPTLLIEKHRFMYGDAYLPEMEDAAIDLIVLAGFLWQVPSTMVQRYQGRIINIHPALLPDFGGKGMYGQKVHKAVLAAGKKESGISIHLVDEIYDHGQVLFQASCPVLPDDTVHSLTKRIHELEHTHFARVIEKQLMAD